MGYTKWEVFDIITEGVHVPLTVNVHVLKAVDTIGNYPKSL